MFLGVNMRPSNSDINKWFTRIRKKLNGTKEYKRKNARTFIKRVNDIDYGISIISLDKAHNNDSLCIGFCCFVGLPFNMEEHWSYFFNYSNYEGIVLEKSFKINDNKSIHNDDWFMINNENMNEMEDYCADIFNEKMIPWLEQYISSDDIINKIDKEMGLPSVLPLIYDPKNIKDYRIEVGSYFKRNLDRQNDKYIDWLFRKNIISEAECKEIKLSSIQAIDKCIFQIRKIGETLRRTEK